MHISTGINWSNTLQSILRDELIATWDSNTGIVNISDNSKAAEFYQKQFENMKGVSRPDTFRSTYVADDVELAELPGVLRQELKPDAIVVELGGSVYQRRSAHMYKWFKNYFPLDISFSSIQRYCEKYDRPGIVANAEALPFKDASIDAFYTHTFLEHPTNPEAVLSEIVRCLKPGGIVIHKDAWFVRWWQRFGVVGIIPFSKQSLKEKLISVGAKITEFPLFRFPPVIFGRAWRETFSSTQKPIKLRYKKLKPNYELMYACDEDAASGIDPLDVIRFYESRGLKHYPTLTKKQRIFFRMPHVILKKTRFKKS